MAFAMRRVGRSGRHLYYVPPPRPIAELPDLLYVGKIAARRAQHMPAHKHDCLELCYIIHGHACWWVEGQPCDVSGGSMIVFREHELHGGVQQAHQPCQYYFLGVRLHRRFPGLQRREVAALTKAIARMPVRCFPISAEIAAAFKTVVDGASAPRSPLTLLEIRTALLQILAAVARAGQARQLPQRSELVRETIRLMNENLELPLSLPAIARRLGWSASHIKTRFRREMGIAPAEFYLRQRIARACMDLAQTRREITEIGHRLGFSSSQYFATAFKRITGKTPRAYRAEALAGAAQEAYPQ
jgi:AraC-like DNA-binding protein